MSHDTLADFKVHKIQELKRQQRREDARELLETVAKQVQPILRNRKWTVPVLKEFLPKNPNLLGLNVNGRRGTTTEIRIRLRYHHSPDSFYPYEDILGTMLHEITHNVQGPHDAKFYAILDELTKECEEFMAKGVTGTGIGFDGPSAGRLGAYSWIPQHNGDPAAMKAAQLKAAQKRAAQQAIMSQGPQRLGGSSAAAKNMTPREAAAAAAERRARDSLWCPSAAIAAGEATVIDMVGDSEDDSDSAEVVNLSKPVRATSILNKPPGNSSRGAKQQQHSNPSQSGSLGSVDRRTLGRPHRPEQSANRSIRKAPVAGTSAAAASTSKAGEAAVARAEAARSQKAGVSAGPMPEMAAAKRQRHSAARAAQERRSGQPSRGQRGHDRGAKAVIKENNTKPSAGNSNHFVGRHATGAANTVDSDDDDDDDDVEILGVCCCGGSIQHPVKYEQRKAAARTVHGVSEVSEVKRDAHDAETTAGVMPGRSCQDQHTTAAAEIEAGTQVDAIEPLSERNGRSHAGLLGKASVADNMPDKKRGRDEMIDLT